MSQCPPRHSKDSSIDCPLAVSESFIRLAISLPSSFGNRRVSFVGVALSLLSSCDYRCSFLRVFRSSSRSCCCRIQTPIVISWRCYHSEISASSPNLLHVSAQEKQVEVLSSSSLTSCSRTSHSLSLALTLDNLCFPAICVSFVCLSLPMPKSEGHLKLFSFHIASL